MFCKTEFAGCKWRVLKTDETACSTQRASGHISLLSPVHISSVHTNNNDLLSVSTLSSHNVETANHRPFLPGPSCHYQTGIALNPLFIKASRHVQHRTLHGEMIIPLIDICLVLQPERTSLMRVAFFYHQAPMLARHATDQKKKMLLGWNGLPFPSPSPLPFHILCASSLSTRGSDVRI